MTPFQRPLPRAARVDSNKKTPPAADIPDRPAHPDRALFRLYETAAICAALVFSGSVGAYDYRLQQGSASGKSANNLYLTSLPIPAPPGDDVGDSTVDDGTAGEAAVGDAAVGDTIVLIAVDDPVGVAAAVDVIAGSSTPEVRVYRPEAGSYASNLAAAGTMFAMRLSERQSGESFDPATGARHRLWARTVSGRGQGRMSDGQNQYTAERSVLQLGGSALGGSFTGKDAWRLGVMAGYGSQRSKTRNSPVGLFVSRPSRGLRRGPVPGRLGALQPVRQHGQGRRVGR